MKLLKVMLVDDELLALNHLKNLISWKDQGFEVAAEYTNPVKALRDFESIAPDIIIADICMPVMDGLEFSRKAMELREQVKIILLTSYKEFEYAKKAVEIGVSNYLLKHEFHADKLLEELNKIKAELERQRNLGSIALGQFIKDLVEGRRTIAEEACKAYMKRLEVGSHFIFMLLQEDLPYPVISYKLKTDVTVLDENLVNHINLPDKLVLIHSVMLENHTWGVLLKTSEHISQRQTWEKVRIAASMLQRLFKKEHGQTITIVSSNMFKDLKELPAVYLEAGNAGEHSIYLGREKILRLYDVDTQAVYDNALIKSGMEDVIKSLEMMDEDDTVRHVDLLFKAVVSDGFNKKGFSLLCEGLVKILDQFRQKKGLSPVFDLWGPDSGCMDRWYTVKDIGEWFAEEFISTVRDIKSKNIKGFSKKVQQVVQYLYEHFSEDICLGDLAERFCMSGDYLRHIFKEETGSTVLDFITMLRIDKSKKLLEGGGYKIYEIAEMVGYRTAQYFSQVFRKVTGINPVDYQEKSEAEKQYEIKY